MMTDDLQIWEQIDRYLSGGMSAKEQELFKATMATDEQLAEMVEASQIANEMVVGHEVLKLKDQMSKDLKKSKNLGTNFGISILALTAIVAGGAYFINKVQQPQAIVAPSVQVQTQSLATKDSAPAPTTQQTTVNQESKQEPASKPAQSVVLPKKETTQKLIEKPASKPSVVATPTQHQPTLGQEAVSQQEPKEKVVQRKENPTVKNEVACSGTIALSWHASPSCIDGHTGSIHINKQTVTGGKAPYQFSVHANGDFSTGDITGLAAGDYTLFVKDANACSYTYKHTATITQITCKDAKKEFTYHMVHDPAWKIPYQADKVATSITITNRSGQEVYNAQVYNGSPEEWNGQSNTGLQVSMGYHVYTIVYTDNTIEQGSIIIVK